MRLLVLSAAALLLVSADGSPAAPPTCRGVPLSASYERSVGQALASGRDIWGEAVLRTPRGPSYAGVHRYLKPLLLVGNLTDSGVYYLALGRPGGPYALHVADGSQVRWRHANGPALTVDVDGERYGSCLTRLATPRLAAGWLPILETSYTDAAGRRYRQESFATSPPDQPESLVRLTVPPHGLARIGTLAVRGPRTAYVAFDGRARTVDEQAYTQARANVASYWRTKLDAGASITVPDARVNDAERNVLIQSLLLGWRYSLGNTYQTFEFPESLANATVLGEYGFADDARTIVESSFRREPHLYPDWELGERLLEAVRYVQLSGDGAFLTRRLPLLRTYANRLATRIGAHGLLPKERFASDLPAVAYSLNGQSVDLQGLRAIAPWVPAARIAAERLARGLRAALNASERRLADGSLFVPVRLLERAAPYDSITASREGSYWNLVIPDALASGLLEPGSAEARDALRYLLLHGSRLLGMLRFDSGGSRLPGYASSGSDDVYELSLERFLADNHQADLLALTLYGQLAAGMTENTFVSGEGATIEPLPGESYRSMYLPPNSTSNASFLECLRLLLVHETGTGRVELAYGTPRAWLAAGKRIAVRDARTTHGRVSFTIAARRGVIAATVSPPARARSLSLRLRLPPHERLGRVTVDGRLYARVDRATATIDLSGLKGPIDVAARVLGAS